MGAQLLVTSRFQKHDGLCWFGTPKRAAGNKGRQADAPGKRAEHGCLCALYIYFACRSCTTRQEQPPLTAAPVMGRGNSLVSGRWK